MSSRKRLNTDGRIDEELVCVDSLKHVLCTRCACRDVDVHREPRDPPDFTVTIDGRPFPTEVTSVLVRENQEFHAHCHEFAEAIRHTAESLGLLSGNYAITVSRLPHIPKSTSGDGRRLIDAAVEYINATRKQEESGANVLIRDATGKLSIQKSSPTGAAVGVVWAPQAMWACEAQDKLTALIQQSVDKKKRKLKHAGIRPGEALLLLYDAFGYAERENVVAAFQRVKGYDWFHFIFWAASFADRQNASYPAEPGREGFFLFCSKREWDGVGTVPLATDGEVYARPARSA